MNQEGAILFLYNFTVLYCVQYQNKRKLMT